MNKKFLTFFLFVLSVGYGFAFETVPLVKFEDKIDLYLGLSVESVIKNIGEPNKQEEIVFSKNKPEFAEIWLYYDGLTVSYYEGEKTIRRIIVDKNSYLLYKGKKISIEKSREKDILNIFEKGSFFVQGEYDVREYVFNKINEHYFIFDHVQFYFNQEKILEKIIIVDDTNFL